MRFPILPSVTLRKSPRLPGGDYALIKVAPLELSPSAETMPPKSVRNHLFPAGPPGLGSSHLFSKIPLVSLDKAPNVCPLASEFGFCLFARNRVLE
jgi:hypothetical protein